MKKSLYLGDFVDTNKFGFHIDQTLTTSIQLQFQNP